MNLFRLRYTKRRFAKAGEYLRIRSKLLRVRIAHTVVLSHPSGLEEVSVGTASIFPKWHIMPKKPEWVWRGPNA